ncbi:hypothetical protein PGT21_033357 [Puccinia graminis f. sp. tritici]|uniref:Phosphotyrosine protein phosphatase I domain-containing protein n=1 Tax=Puccinia graminis f. sp. tritici TaxID=56615 RepID=A0A5B0N5V6_PUCGR|nr:hypothetical protein PGT21_033357 [Puccinia graminis f. sp. tritici]
MILQYIIVLYHSAYRRCDTDYRTSSSIKVDRISLQKSKRGIIIIKMSSQRKVSVLFVCLGNICRSPMAEAVFTHLVELNELQDRFETIASAGTAAYHVGEQPDPRTVCVCNKFGVAVNSVAQQVESSHFNTFDYILAMDTSNLRNLREMQPPKCKAQVKLFGEFGDGDIIKDPYYGANDGFTHNFRQCVDYSVGLLKSLGSHPVKSIL